MYGNGAVTGIIAVTTHQVQLPIPPDLQVALSAWAVAVAGTAALAAVVLRIATAALLATAAAF